MADVLGMESEERPRPPSAWSDPPGRPCQRITKLQRTKSACA
ncbi:MAG: hypothetical protein QF415_12665 [Candidatus Undinarchaeales archaeon]|nr:hypothetical protein [Candidatus Undinarchaeales archaeon]